MDGSGCHSADGAGILVVSHVVTWNSAATIEACLESILGQQELSPAELDGQKDSPAAAARPLIIQRVRVTDNASKDRTVELLRERFGDRIELVCNTQNTGFTGAHNEGIRAALESGAHYYFALNPDMTLAPETLRTLVDAIAPDTRCGAITPKVLRADSALRPTVPPRLDTTGMYMTPGIRHFDRGSEEFDCGQYEAAEYVFGVSGAAALYRRDFLLDAALRDGTSLAAKLECFDETFFAYREDAELSWRGQELGWRFRYEPRAVAHHIRRVLPSRRSELPVQLNALSVKNRFLMQFAHLGAGDVLSYHPARILRNALVAGGVLLQERSSLPALRSAFQLRPFERRRREAVRAKRRVSPAELRYWFKTLPVSLPALSERRPPEKLASLAAIVVNYNSGSRLAGCLKQLLPVIQGLGESVAGEVVVVDNASSDDSAARVRELLAELPGFHLDCSPRNLGFAGAINHAVQFYPADAYLILNPDVEIDVEAIRELVAALDRYSDLAAVAPILCDAKERVQHGFIARTFPTLGSTLAELFFLHRLWPENPWTSRYQRRRDPFLVRYAARLRSSAPAPYDEPNRPLLVDQPPGACLLVRGRDFSAVEGMDEGFWPAWFEDVDFCQRLAKRGRRCALVASATAVHEGGYSKQQIGATRYASIWYPNLLRYWRIHGTAGQFRILRALLPFALIMRASVASLRALLARGDNRKGWLELGGTLFRLAVSTESLMGSEPTADMVRPTALPGRHI